MCRRISFFKIRILFKQNFGAKLLFITQLIRRFEQQVTHSSKNLFFCVSILKKGVLYLLELTLVFSLLLISWFIASHRWAIGVTCIASKANPFTWRRSIALAAYGNQLWTILCIDRPYPRLPLQLNLKGSQGFYLIFEIFSSDFAPFRIASITLLFLTVV